MNHENKSLLIIYAFLFTLILTFNNFAAGEVDPTFNGSAQFGANGPVYDSYRQPDGKVIICGRFSVVNGSHVNSLARLNADGSVDTTFNPPYSQFISQIFAVAAQPDGKVLVGVSKVIRLNADGSPDNTFNVTDNTTNFIYDIEVQADGKIIAGGIFNTSSPGARIARYNTDGSIDSAFSPTFAGIIKDIEILPDNSYILGGYYAAGGQGFVVKLTNSGALDPAFTVVGATSNVEAVAVQSDGKIVFGGTFLNAAGNNKRSISRVNADGTMDPTFSPGNSGSNGSVFALGIQPDGKLLVGGAFTIFNGISKSNLVRLNSDGTLDQTFTADLGNIGQVETILPTENSRILVGYSGVMSEGQLNGLKRLNSDGSTDTTIQYYIGSNGLVRKVLEQPDGKLIIAGEFDVAGNAPRPSIARLNRDGTIDATFNPTFPVNSIYSIALQPDGKILFGTYGGLTFRRLNSDGSMDNSFSPGLNGAVYDIVVQPNGQILAAGDMLNLDPSRANIARFDINGGVLNSLTSLGPQNKIYLLSSGKILIGGNGLRRLNSDFTTDTSFVLTQNVLINDLDVQADGKIVVVGSFNGYSGNSQQVNIARITADGFTDPTFAQNTTGELYGVKIQSDGKILVSGAMALVNGNVYNGLVRLNGNASIDGSFRADANNVVYDVILTSDNKILVGGKFTRINGISKVAIARLNNNVTPQRTAFDFDGDGRTDVVVYRPASLVWYQLLGQNYQFSAVTFGIGEDITSPADFDGDGKTDLGIFRPSTGTFWYRSTAQGNAFRAVQWGQAGDIPLPSDFNGDGRDDYVVYRPSNNTWYRLTETGVYSSIVFGLAGDKPVIGDFDGDGKSDYAIFRPSTGTWWYAASSQNNAFRAVQFGSNGDVPAPADYDGDGKTDPAVYRPSNGVWYILKSANNSVTIAQFGLNGDKPVAGDYDGDGRADIAVFRPSNGTWYLNRSTAGFVGIQWGTTGDVPSPNAYLHP